MQNKYLYIISLFYENKPKTLLKTKQVKQDILNQWESIGFPQLICIVEDNEAYN